MDKQIAESFDPTTLKKIGKGALIAGGGAALTYFSEYIVNAEFGIYTAVVVAVLSIIINAVKEYFAGIEI